MKHTTIATTLLAALTLGFAAPGTAQQQQHQAPPPAADIEVSDTQLEAFADAQSTLGEIQQDYAGRMQSVDDPEKANELREEANAEMVDAVEESGLTVETFNQIAQAVQNDPELQQRLAQIDR